MHPSQERTLLTRLEAARQVYNACLSEARKRVRLVRESQAFKRARTLSRDDPERKRLFAQARQQHACSDYALHTFAKPLGHSWLGEHLDSHTIQKLASRAYAAANRLLVGKAKRVRGVWPAPAGQRGGQDQCQWHSLVRGPRGVDRAGVACQARYP